MIEDTNTRTSTSGRHNATLEMHTYSLTTVPCVVNALKRRSHAPSSSRSRVRSAVAPPSESELALARDDAVAGCTECSLPNEHARARAISRALNVPNTGHARVLVIGAETGALLAELVREGAAPCTALCVDASAKMLARAASAIDSALVTGIDTLGNARGVRFMCDETLRGVKPYQGPFDGAVFNAHLVDRGDESAIAEALTRVVMLCKPGARVVISERFMGDGNDKEFDFSGVVRKLPLARVDQGASTSSATKDIHAANESSSPLRADVDDEPLVFAVPPTFGLAKRMRLEAPVVHGFGRGSKQMGVPTANLAPELCGGEAFLSTLPLGVYFGWAKLKRDVEWRECVLNVGKRPTFVDGDGTTIEVHVMGTSDLKPQYDTDFYGEEMSVDVCGFIRPEIRFESLHELVGRIKTDIGLARNALASGAHAAP
jgi:riboflavin kinase